MPQDDEFGFWQDERSLTGPIPRLSRRPTLEPAPLSRRGGNDRRPNYVTRRIGLLVAFGLAAVPVAMAFGGSDQGRARVAAAEAGAAKPATAAASVGTVRSSDPATVVVTAGPSEPPTQPAVVQATAPAATAASSPAPSTQAPPTASQAATTTATLPVAPPATAHIETVSSRAPSSSAAGGSGLGAVGAPASVDQKVEIKRSCANQYEVVVGDYWILIANKVSVRLAEVLSANNATSATPLYPGRSICLPANASPPTTDVAETRAPATTGKGTTKPSAPPPASSAAPTTAPTTAVPPTAGVPPKNNYTTAEVEQIIRGVWPDELEDEAIRIATRESRLIPTVRNSCCLGLFQIYWDVHKGWMAASGITSSNQLFDPYVNAYMAYAIYLRAGGWGPWR